MNLDFTPFRKFEQELERILGPEVDREYLKREVEQMNELPIAEIVRVELMEEEE